MRHPRILLTLLLALCATSFAAEKKYQPAIIRSLTQVSGPWKIVLDFVEVRDCNCAGGIEVVNKNDKLRTFTFDTKVKIRLLKDAGAYADATPEQLAAGRDGKNFGWPFSADTPFEFRFDAAQKRVVEIRQIYFP